MTPSRLRYSFARFVLDVLGLCALAFYVHLGPLLMSNPEAVSHSKLNDLSELVRVFTVLFFILSMCFAAAAYAWAYRCICTAESYYGREPTTTKAYECDSQVKESFHDR